MTVVTADASLRALLSQIKEVTEIRDQDGNLLGYYKPRTQVEAEVYERARGLFDPAETGRRKEAEHGKGLPIEEVMRRLKPQEDHG